MFNVRVPLEARDDVFLMNTITDAQLIVSSDVASLLDRCTAGADMEELDDEAREALGVLQENGFLVSDRDADQLALDRYFFSVTTNSSELHITILTTLQCNFACDYCFQGDHGDYNKFAEKMTLDTSGKVVRWIERQLDSVRPEKFVLTFFGGEPLLNLPVMYYLAERLWRATESRE